MEEVAGTVEWIFFPFFFPFLGKGAFITALKWDSRLEVEQALNAFS